MQPGSREMESVCVYNVNTSAINDSVFMAHTHTHTHTHTQARRCSDPVQPSGARNRNQEQRNTTQALKSYSPHL